MLVLLEGMLVEVGLSLVVDVGRGDWLWILKGVVEDECC